jgi:hypothetical protein
VSSPAATSTLPSSPKFWSRAKAFSEQTFFGTKRSFLRLLPGKEAG